MYICVCHGHRERDIREAAKTGLRGPREVYRHLGKPPQCGRCLVIAAKVIDEVHQSACAAQPVACAAQPESLAHAS